MNDLGSPSYTGLSAFRTSSATVGAPLSGAGAVLQWGFDANASTMLYSPQGTSTLRLFAAQRSGGNLHAWSELFHAGNFGPATITNSTTNSSAGATHTHALSISKADVGLSAVENTAISSWSSSYMEDVRGGARAPNYYGRRQASWSFHDANSISGNPPGDTYTAALTVHPWTSFNGGHRPQQLAFTGTGGLKFRFANSDTAWAAWQNIAMGDVAEAESASTIPVRTSAGDIFARLFRSSYPSSASIPATASIAMRHNDGSDNYIRFISNGDALRNWMGVGAGDAVTFGEVSGGFLRATSNRIYGGAGDLFIVGNGSNGIGFRPRGWATANQSYLDNNGNWTINGTVTASDYIISSDRSLKRHISDLATSKDTWLQPKTYLHVETGEIENGFVAQDVKKIWPRMVTKRADGKLAIKYPRLTAALAHQDLRLRDELKAQNKRIKKLELLIKKLLKR